MMRLQQRCIPGCQAAGLSAAHQRPLHALLGTCRSGRRASLAGGARTQAPAPAARPCRLPLHFLPQLCAPQRHPAGVPPRPPWTATAANRSAAKRL